MALEPVYPSPLGYRYTVRDAIASIDNTEQDIRDASSEGYAVGSELRFLRSGDTSQRYFQLRRASWDAPVGSITQEGGKVHAASECHPDRIGKFTLPELRRLCAFPDDFVLTGTYRQGYERLGRAVPPVMMSHIAATIRDKILAAIE